MAQFSKNLYVSYYFVDLNVDIEELSDDKVNVIYNLVKGKKAKISKIYFVGDKKVRDKKINDGESFLKFKDQDIERQFIESLLKAVGKNGTIFPHNAKGVEIKTLERLKDKDNCKNLADKIDKLIDRVEDSLIIARKNF